MYPSSHNINNANRMKVWLRRLTAPVSRCPGLFLCLFTLMALMPFVTGYHIAKTMEIFISDFSLQSLAEPVAGAWTVSGIYMLLRSWRKWASAVWLVLCFIILWINLLTDIFIVSIYHIPFDDDIAAVLCATNPSEGYNFFRSYLLSVLPRIITFSSVIALSYIVGKYTGSFIKRHTRKYETAARTATLAVVVAAWTGCFLPCNEYVDSMRLSSKILTFIRIDNGHELVPVNPELITEPEAAPTKFVVVIGESHCRTHSSLYGYDHPTQPGQERLAADSALYVFQGAVAPETYTVGCFKHFIGTWNGEKDRKWYEQFTFLEAARLSGYRLLWFSTQSRKGVYDNPVARIADFCDVTEYTNDGMNGYYSASIDEELFPIIDRHFNSSSKEFIVLHLMGCHGEYKLRYPESYDRFKSSDYPELPENQRSTIAEYDNAVLYNDHILSEIYRRFADTDAVIVYFSDHAQDLFTATPDYFGHAITENPVSVAAVREIPLTIYITEKYKRRHPEMARRIAAASRGEDPIYTTDIIYTLMDLMGTRFADNSDVAGRSILNRSTKGSRPKESH